MLTRVFFILVAVAIMLFVIGLLRSRKLREKYAALWILVGLAIVVLAVVPDLLGALAGALDIQVPSNLLFALAIFLLLGVALHLSLEISRMEDETRVLAENIAVLDLVVREAGLTADLEGRRSAPEDPQAPDAGPPGQEGPA